MTGRKSALEVWAIGFMLALSIVFMLVFNMAIINGGETLVKLNIYGEMVPELLVLNLVVWPTISAGLYAWHQRGRVASGAIKPQQTES